MGSPGMGVVSRRSARQKLKTRRVTVETDGVVYECDSRDYTLNIKRALEKKAIRCLNDVCIKHEIKSDNHVFEMSSAIYEVYKANTLHYFENICGHSRVNVKHVTDRHGNIVETQVKTYTKDNSKYPEQLKYCINMYHTKGRLLVNGRDVKDFVRDHKEIVRGVLSYKGLNGLDKLLYDRIQGELAKIEALEKRKGSKPPLQPNPTWTASTGSSQMCLDRNEHSGDTLCDEKSNTEDESAQCLHCDANMGEDSIECGS